MFPQGLVNRSVRMGGRPIRIEQIDKIKPYLGTLIPKVEHQKIHQQKLDLAAPFVKHGRGTTNESSYNKVYTEVVDFMQGTANEVGKLMFEYAPLQELTTRGQMVLVHKQLLCSKKRHASPTEALHEQTERYRMDINNAIQKPLKEMTQEVRRRQHNFWECRSLAETERVV